MKREIMNLAQASEANIWFLHFSAVEKFWHQFKVL